MSRLWRAQIKASRAPRDKEDFVCAARPLDLRFSPVTFPAGCDHTAVVSHERDQSIQLAARSDKHSTYQDLLADQSRR